MKKAKHDCSSHVAAIKTQGASTSAYARRHGLALSTLYYWQRKLHSASVGHAKAKPVAPTKQSGKFVALRVCDIGGEVQRATTGCTLVLTGAMRLEMARCPTPSGCLLCGVARKGCTDA